MSRSKRHRLAQGHGRSRQVTAGAAWSSSDAPVKIQKRYERRSRLAAVAAARNPEGLETMQSGSGPAGETRGKTRRPERLAVCLEGTLSGGSLDRRR